MLFYHGNGDTRPKKQISNERLCVSSMGGMAGGALTGTALFFTKTMGAWSSASLGLMGCLVFCAVTTCALSTDANQKESSINDEESPMTVHGSPYQEVPLTPEDSALSRSPSLGRG